MNNTIKVAVKEFNKNQKRFDFLANLQLAAIPTKNDKISFNINGTGYIFKIHDVHFGDDGMVDINVIRISNITNYLHSKYEYPE